MITVSGVSKRFGAFEALKNIHLEVRDGEFLALLGPSGSGKTTLLRIIAGLEFPDRGGVSFDGEDVTGLKIAERKVGFVFQHYALFKHMTVADNIGFGLSVRSRRERPAKSAIKARAAELLELVQLGGLGSRYPAQLSGGQRQRVALARALAVEPQLLLLDEPFGALDAKVRKELRRWLRQLHGQMGLTSIFVTHDQEEALSMSDQIVVMNAGRTEQIGSPEEVYEAPATAFVADFLGKANMLPGVVSSVDGLKATIALSAGQVVTAVSPKVLAPGAHVSVVVRPQKLSVGAAATANRLAGRVVSTSYLGGSAIYEIDIGERTTIRANTQIDGRIAREGEAIDVGFDPAGCVLMDEKGLRIA